MTLQEWIEETEAHRPECALWPSETDARRFRDVWCTGRERLESNAWDDEDAAAYWWLVKPNGSTVSVTERDEVLRGALVPGSSREGRTDGHENNAGDPADSSRPLCPFTVGITPSGA